MSKLVWGDPGNRFYEVGVDRGVLYPTRGKGVPWNGLIAVQEAPSGADISEDYHDGRKILSKRKGEGFAATISAYTYPREFEEYDGFVDGVSAQNRPYFGFSYRTQIANDTNPDAGHLIHLVYNAQATPSSRSYSTMGASTDPANFSWSIDTVPVILPEGQITSHLIINTAMTHAWATEAFEDIIYGTAESDPYLPSIPEVLELFEAASIFRVTDHGDGTWTAEGPDEAIDMLTSTFFIINWPSAVYIDTKTYMTYKLSSL